MCSNTDSLNPVFEMLPSKHIDPLDAGFLRMHVYKPLVSCSSANGQLQLDACILPADLHALTCDC